MWDESGGESTREGSSPMQETIVQQNGKRSRNPNMRPKATKNIGPKLKETCQFSSVACMCWMVGYYRIIVIP